MITARVQLAGTGRLAERLAPLVDAAADCLERNVVPGRGPGEPARFLRAGGGYPDPWTRDAAVNAWQAGAWLLPEVTASTLAMVCGADGTVADDDQEWDSIIWVLGARELALATGDRAWAERGHRVGAATFARWHDRHLDPVSGLYRGPAVMADGITGYPQEFHEPGNPSSFVLDHPGTRGLCCLSTNALAVLSLDALGDLAESCELDADAWRQRAHDLAATVAERFRLPDGGLGYLVADGRVRPHQETLGLALAILAGVVDGEAARRIVAAVHHEPFGIPAVWPAFEGVPEGRFGRHGTALWPMVMGVWAQAVAATGDAVAFEAELERLCTLFERSDGEFFEVYSPTTGEPDGGWQSGRDWRSEPDQTWSAATFLGTVLRATPLMSDVVPRTRGTTSLAVAKEEQR